MPSDCASDVQDVSKYIDDVAGSGDPALEEDLKRLLRLDDVTNMVDVAASRKSSLCFLSSFLTGVSCILPGDLGLPSYA